MQGVVLNRRYCHAILHKSEIMSLKMSALCSFGCGEPVFGQRYTI